MRLNVFAVIDSGIGLTRVVFHSALVILAGSIGSAVGGPVGLAVGLGIMGFSLYVPIMEDWGAFRGNAKKFWNDLTEPSYTYRRKKRYCDDPIVLKYRQAKAARQQQQSVEANKPQPVKNPHSINSDNVVVDTSRTFDVSKIKNPHSIDADEIVDTSRTRDIKTKKVNSFKRSVAKAKILLRNNDINDERKSLERQRYRKVASFDSGAYRKTYSDYERG
ncbi:MAG: hypothetical protein J6P93_01590 [Alphaproteobacteria bacterium]|nr:hypothetical protein [Alphaproteobacteria bacterium]